MLQKVVGWIMTEIEGFMKLCEALGLGKVRWLGKEDVDALRDSIKTEHKKLKFGGMWKGKKKAKSFHWYIKSEFITGDTLNLYAVYADGSRITQGDIMQIIRGKRIYRCKNVTEDIELDLEEGNRVVII